MKAFLHAPLTKAGARLRLNCQPSARVTVRVVKLAAVNVGDDAHLVEAPLRVGREVRERELAREQRVNVSKESVEAHGRARPLEDRAPPRLFREAVERALTVADEREVPRPHR